MGSMGWLDYPICCLSMSLLSRLTQASSPNKYWCYSLTWTHARNSFPLEPSVLAHQAFTLPFHCGLHLLLLCSPSGDFFFSVCLYNLLPSCGKRLLTVQMAWAASGLIWAGTPHPWASLECSQRKAVPLCLPDSIISLVCLTSFWTPTGSAFHLGLIHVLCEHLGFFACISL